MTAFRGAAYINELIMAPNNGTTVSKSTLLAMLKGGVFQKPKFKKVDTPDSQVTLK
jgi:hypothetical protein